MRLVGSFTLCFILCSQLCFSQADTIPKTRHVEEFNWTITIPDAYKLVADADWDAQEKKGEDFFENAWGEDIVNEAVTLFAYKSGQYNSFDANWQAYDEAVDGDYKESNDGVNQLIFATLKSEMRGVFMDSTSSIQMIDGLKFHRFDINIELTEEITFRVIGMSRPFGKKDFTMNIGYIDEKVGEQMLAAVLNSRFR